MMIFVDSGEFDTFNCTYGLSEEKSGALRVFVEGGLTLPYGIFLEEEDGVCFFKYEEDNSENVGKVSPRHYTCDLLRRVEYVEWELSDGHLLRVRTKSDKWVQYTSKTDNQYTIYGLVGGC